MKDLENIIKRTISHHLGVAEKEITSVSHLIEDLNASPLEIADIIIRLENIFQIKVPQEEIEKFGTVGDIITFFSDNL